MGLPSSWQLCCLAGFLRGKLRPQVVELQQKKFVEQNKVGADLNASLELQCCKTIDMNKPLRVGFEARKSRRKNGPS